MPMYFGDDRTPDSGDENDFTGARNADALFKSFSDR